MTRRRSSNTKRSRIDNWDDQRDEILLKILKEQKSLGKGVGGHFPYDLWPTIVQTFNCTTDLSLGRENLKNRLKVLNRTFALYQSIVRKDGWAWDDDRNTPKPDTPSSWNEIIVGNPRYTKCKWKPFPRYRDMEFLCGGKQSKSGSKVNSATTLQSAEVPLDQYEADSTQPMPQPAGNSANPVQQDNEASSEEQPSSFSSEQRITYAPLSCRKRQERVSDTPIKVVGTDREHASKTKAYSIEDCMKKLEKVEGISPDAFVAACEGFKDQDNRTIFMNLDSQYLQAWVERQVNIDRQLMTQVRQQLVGSI